MKFPLLWNKEKKRKHFRIHMCCISHTGKVRMKNEDNFLFRGTCLPRNHISMQTPFLWTADSRKRPMVAVFDGMGGENAGELASYTAAKIMAEVGQGTAPYSKENLTDTLRYLNRGVCEISRERRLGQIGTTVTLFAFEESSVWIANLGDSPAFQFRNGRLTRISHAHTNERFLMSQGIQRKPALTQFLGIEEDEFIQEPYIERWELASEDIYLLCSDGLTDMVSEEEIRLVLQRTKDVENALEELLQMALEHGGRDNITILICKADA